MWAARRLLRSFARNFADSQREEALFEAFIALRTTKQEREIVNALLDRLEEAEEPLEVLEGLEPERKALYEKFQRLNEEFDSR